MIQTSELLRAAFAKCPQLVSISPDYHLYMKASNTTDEIIIEYSPKVKRFGIDECFIDYTNMEVHFGEPVEVASTIRNRLKDGLGFTVNLNFSK